VAAVITVKALGTALEVVTALLATAQSATLGLELVDADGRESGGAVVLGSMVVDLVDGDGGVHNLRLDDLLVKDGLNLLVDVAGTSCQSLFRARPDEDCRIARRTYW
jgi:hypothetical protein